VYIPVQLNEILTIGYMLVKETLCQQPLIQCLLNDNTILTVVANASSRQSSYLRMCKANNVYPSDFDAKQHFTAL